MRSETDDELVARAREGAGDCFSELVHRHKDRVYSMIRRQVRDDAAAADLAQDTFLRAFQKLHSFRGDAQFSTWLIRIGLNITNSFFASAAYRRSQKSEPFDAEKHDSIAREPGEIEAIRSAVRELKPIFREVFVLCALEGFSYEEAASTLNIPVGTVRSRLNSARLQLAEVLRDE